MHLEASHNHSSQLIFSQNDLHMKSYFKRLGCSENFCMVLLFPALVNGLMIPDTGFPHSLKIYFISLCFYKRSTFIPIFWLTERNPMEVLTFVKWSLILGFKPLWLSKTFIGTLYLQIVEPTCTSLPQQNLGEQNNFNYPLPFCVMGFPLDRL